MLVERTKLIIRLMKKTMRFRCDYTCTKVFLDIKKLLSSLPILYKHFIKEPILVYLLVFEKSIKVILVQEIDGKQKLIYFIDRRLQDIETYR